MTIEDEARAMHKELSNLYQKLALDRVDYFELKSLELDILRIEAQLRDLGIEF